MEAVLVNYNYNPTWVLEYPDLEPIIYDRSDDGIERNLTRYGPVYKTENIGNVDYDKLGYLIKNYDALPEYFLWGKSNLFKYISKEEFDAVKDNQTFTPLLTQNHHTYSDNTLPEGNPVCFYKDKMYHERKGIVNTLPGLMLHKYFDSWEEWCKEFHIPEVGHIPFPPGGNFILTREAVWKYSRDFYQKMRDTLDYTQLPFEAQLAERSYYLLWR